MTTNELYYKISEAYSSPHNDTRDQIMECFAMIDKALKQGVEPQALIDKAREMAVHAGDYKSKLHTAFINKFWEKKYQIPLKNDRINFED